MNLFFLLFVFLLSESLLGYSSAFIQESFFSWSNRDIFKHLEVTTIVITVGLNFKSLRCQLLRNQTVGRNVISYTDLPNQYRMSVSMSRPDDVLKHIGSRYTFTPNGTSFE